MLRCAPGSVICVCIGATRRAANSNLIRLLLKEAYGRVLSNAQRKGDGARAGDFDWAIDSLRITLALQDTYVTWGELRGVIRTLDEYMQRNGYIEADLEVVDAAGDVARGYIFDAEH